MGLVVSSSTKLLFNPRFEGWGFEGRSKCSAIVGENHVDLRRESVTLCDRGRDQHIATSGNVVANRHVVAFSFLLILFFQSGDDRVVVGVENFPAGVNFGLVKTGAGGVN